VSLSIFKKIGVFFDEKGEAQAQFFVVIADYGAQELKQLVEPGGIVGRIDFGAQSADKSGIVNGSVLRGGHTVFIPAALQCNRVKT